MNTVRQVKKAKLLLLLTLGMLFVLSACNTAAPPTPTLEAAAEDTGFAFRVDPENEVVIPVGPTVESATPTLQAQADGDTRLLVQGEDIRFKDFSFQFKSPNRLVVRLRVENITEDLDFTQPFFFTLSSTSQNIVRARAPLVTDAQLGGDGVLSPGETSKRFRFVVTFREDEPFTFFVDARAVVVERTACVGPVEIPDAALEQAIRNELGQEGELTCEDLAALETLDTASVPRIQTLEGLQFAANLRELSIAGDNVTDLSPLENLINLNTLNLSSNNISDISALVANSGLGEGDTVNLTDNPLSPQARDDIEVLRARGVIVSADEAGACTGPVDVPNANLEAAIRDELGKPEGELSCEDLAELRELAAFSVGDLEGIQFAVNLTDLDLSLGNFSDITLLGGLTELRSLNLERVDVDDLAPLANLTNLTTLFVGGSDVSDLAPLANLTNLTTLFVGGGGVSDLTPLANLTNLTSLLVSGDDLGDLTPLAGLTRLVRLEIPSSNVGDLAPLANLTALEALFLRGNRVRNVGPLADLTSLLTLDLSNNAVRDVAPLADLNVTSLDLSGNRISSLDPLGSLTGLTSLQLFDAGISDIAALESLTELEILDLSGNAISDVAALVNNSGLGAGDGVLLLGNPLNSQALEDVETLRERGVEVLLNFDE